MNTLKLPSFQPTTQTSLPAPTVTTVNTSKVASSPSPTTSMTISTSTVLEPPKVIRLEDGTALPEPTLPAVNFPPPSSPVVPPAKADLLS